MRTKPSTDISNITDRGTGSRSEIRLWSSWIENYSKTIWKPKFQTTPSIPKLHTSISRGPNSGESMIARMYDILAFCDRGVWPLFIKACKSFNRIDVLTLCFDVLGRNALLCQNKAVKAFVRKKDPKHTAALIYLADKAGKTRVVYCLTWWFQELLHPLHRRLYLLLYTIKQDGTKSHSEAAQTVRKWTCEGRRLWSVD